MSFEQPRQSDASTQIIGSERFKIASDKSEKPTHPEKRIRTLSESTSEKLRKPCKRKHTEEETKAAIIALLCSENIAGDHSDSEGSVSSRSSSTSSISSIQMDLVHIRKDKRAKRMPVPQANGNRQERSLYRHKLIDLKLLRGDEHSADLVDWFGHEFDVDMENLRKLVPIYNEYHREDNEDEDERDGKRTSRDKERRRRKRKEGNVEDGDTSASEMTQQAQEVQITVLYAGAPSPSPAPSPAPSVPELHGTSTLPLTAVSSTATSLLETVVVESTVSPMISSNNGATASIISTTTTSTLTEASVVVGDALIAADSRTPLLGPQEGSGLPSPSPFSISHPLITPTPTSSPPPLMLDPNVTTKSTLDTLSTPIATEQKYQPQSLPLRSQRKQGRLYLGGWRCSTAAWLKEKRIGLVINAAIIPDILEATNHGDDWLRDCEQMEKSGVTYLRLDWLDTDKQRLWKKTPWDDLVLAVNTIHEHLSKGRNVFVHCRKGRSRSATVILAYYMARRGLRRADAIQLLMDRRPQIAPNSYFVAQLWDFERSIELKQLQARVGLPSIARQAKASLVGMLTTTPSQLSLNSQTNNASTTSAHPLSVHHATTTDSHCLTSIAESASHSQARSQ